MNLPLNLIKFFTPSYFFDLRAPIALSTVYFLLVFFGLLVVAAITVKFSRASKKRENFSQRLLDKYFYFFLVLGLGGWFLVWCRYELVYFLGGRFWLLIWLLVLAVWLGRILKYQFKVVPQAKLQLEKKKVFEKYLPKKK